MIWSNRRTLVVFSFAAVAGVALSAEVAAGRPILAARWGLLWTLGLWAATWIVASCCARRVGLGLILLAAVALRLAALAGPPTTSDDLYRYAWDGRVQHAGVDPYAHPPSAPELTTLREGWLWPDDGGCAALHRPRGCTRVNRPAVRTIYPPVAEAWFGGVSRLLGIGARHKAWQVAGLFADLVTVGLLVVALRRYHRDTRWVAWYALCPLPVLEFVNNAHVDGLALALAIGGFAILTAPAHRARLRTAASRDLAFGLLVGGAALVKLYPAILLLAIVGARRARPWASFLRAGAAAAALTVVTYAPHVVAVGTRVIGYLPGYLKEEHYQQGSRFLLTGMTGLHGREATAAAALLVVLPVAWVAWRRPDPPLAAAVLLCALIVAATPVQPWYATAIVAFATLSGYPAATAIAVAGYPYFFAVILDHRHAVALGRVSYAVGAAIGAATLIGSAPYAERTAARSIARQQ